MAGRAFRTVEDAQDVWRKEYERTEGKSGILCKCSCYHIGDKIRETDPIGECTLLIPEGIYRKYEKNTTEEDRDYRSKAHVAVIVPGVIRVRKYPDDKNNFSVNENLCKRSCNVEYLLNKHLGQKIRLGKNLGVK